MMTVLSKKSRANAIKKMVWHVNDVRVPDPKGGVRKGKKK